jgi:hypothetical protein
MPGLVPSMHERLHRRRVDGRDKPGHDSVCDPRRRGGGIEMSDREAAVRARVCDIFAPFADCAPEAALTDGGRVDVLIRPRRVDLAGVSIAIECKDPQRTIGDALLGRWLKQCADYVGAAPANGWPPIVAGFAWPVDQPLDPRQEERIRMAGMMMLAAHLRVGWATGAAWPFDTARSYCSRLARLGVTLDEP